MGIDYILIVCLMEQQPKKRPGFRSKGMGLLLHLMEHVDDTTPDLNVFALYIIGPAVNNRFIIMYICY